MLGSMILMYPLIQILGIDFIFFAIGLGIHNGLVSEQSDDEINDSHILLLIVFTLFGTKLSLDNAVFLGKSGWTASLLIAAAIIVVRMVIISLIHRVEAGKKLRLGEITPFITFGPLSIIILRRFLPGFQNALNGGMNSTSVYAICTMSIMVTIAVSCCLVLAGNLVVKRQIN